jgi:hypothetical protein
MKNEFRFLRLAPVAVSLVGVGLLACRTGRGAGSADATRTDAIFLADALHSSQGRTGYLPDRLADLCQNGAPCSSYPGDTVCVIAHGEVGLSAAQYDSVRHTWLVHGSPNSLAYRPTPPPYVDSRDWFAQRQAVRYRGHRFQMYALPIIRLPAEVKRLGEFDGIALYAEAGSGSDEENPGIVYAPLSPGCQYQPYYFFDESGPVRGR